MRRTPPPSADPAEAVPALRPLARTAVRLHPRPGEVAPGDSHLGGPFLWPAGAPLPTCPEHGASFVLVLQLARADVPEAPFPDGADWLQLFWCPNDHPGVGHAPDVRVEWHAASAALRARGPVEPEEYDSDGYLPRPCSLHPERVVEYPGPQDLPDEVRAALAADPALDRAARALGLGDAAYLYQTCLSAAPGTKVGGYEVWVQDPDRPVCPAGHPMAFLLTVDSAEFDGASWHRWLADEDRDAWGAPYDARLAVQNAAGIELGDAGNLHVYACLACEGRPVTAVHQCS